MSGTAAPLPSSTKARAPLAGRSLARARAWAWGLILLVLLAYAGRAWLSDLRNVVSGLVSGVRHAASTGAFTPDAPLHGPADAVVTVGVIAAWTVLAVAAPRRAALRPILLDGRLTIGMVLFPLGGIAMLVLLAMTLLSSTLSTPPWLAGLVALALVAAIVAGTRIRKPPAPPSSAVPGYLDDGGERGPRPTWAYRALQVVAAVALALLVYALGRDVVNLAVFRPAASGDEAYFWWTSTDLLHRLDFRAYVASFAVAGYPPAYPIQAGLLLGWLPDAWFAAAGRALPYVYGFTALVILLGRVVTWRTLLSPVAGIYYVLAFLLLERLSWVHDLLFSLWYGEAPAIVAFALVLVLVDHAGGPAPASLGGSVAASGRARMVGLALLGLGTGAFGVLIKPPLSFLLVPAIVPTLAVAGVVLRRPGQPLRPLAVVLASIAIGGVLAQLAWSAVLGEAGRSAVYSVDLRSLLDFHPERSFSKLVPYFLSVYQPVWVAFVLVTGLAFLADWRRFLPLWLVSIGMIASILVLYLGAWSDVEHESGARYILHGAYGWMLVALGALAPAISRTIRAWTEWLAIGSLQARLTEARRMLGTSADRSWASPPRVHDAGPSCYAERRACYSIPPAGPLA